jgi:1-acyl-sn-glycerol-3-phosphate acyltransferase
LWPSCLLVRAGRKKDLGLFLAIVGLARPRAGGDHPRVMSLREEIDDRLARLEVPFGRYGVDSFGVSKAHLANFYRILGVLYKDYFRVRAYGVHNVPASGRAMLVGNHSGGVAIDGAMVIASMFFEMEPPRLAQGMVEKFIGKVPFASAWSSRVGQFTGLPEHAQRLLDDDRLLMVFPEGSRGTAKLYWERTNLVNFGSGFVRLALASRAPIVTSGLLPTWLSRFFSIAMSVISL